MLLRSEPLRITNQKKLFVLFYFKILATSIPSFLFEF